MFAPPGAPPDWDAEYEPEAYNVPKYVATQATFLKRGGKWVVTASGGVQLFPWQIADEQEEVAALGELRTETASKENKAWWWQ